MRLSPLFLAGVSALSFATAASAQDPAPAADAGSEIIVTGTRVANRTRLDTIAPVDVISKDSLAHQGTPELATALAAVTPSINFPRPSGNDGSDTIRPAILRGLSPDETLVLINGVRAHSASYLNVNGALGRGSAAVDLNTVPDVALESVEVLRDGASAQYGSDAIAGVVNLRLREASHGGGVSVSHGIYATDFTTPRAGKQGVNGEPVTQASAWQGFALGGDGFVTVSADYQHRAQTNRADIDPRTLTTSPQITGFYGDPKLSQYSGWVNFGKPVGDAWQLYGWAGYQYRNATTTEFPRLAAASAAPGSSNTYAASVGINGLYPFGFVPLLNTRSSDINSALGLKGDIAGWAVNAKVSYGRNQTKLHTNDSANYTLGAATPTRFYDGKFTYDQIVGGVDVSKQFAVLSGLNVAWGAEVRHETYKIGAGDPASYTGGAAQGYGGLSPANVVDAKRTAESLYLDLELQATGQLRLGAAGRYEHYSDFGSTGTGKLSARYDLTPNFALRATGSTGFRAPALQQEYFTSVVSSLDTATGTLRQTGTYPATSAVAGYLGGQPLKPEKSASVSAGVVVRSGGFSLTVDGYFTHVRNGLALSENLNNGNLTPAAFAQLQALTAASPVQAARFFINGLGITTKGIDAVAHYKLLTAGAGSFDFTLAGNVGKQKVTRAPSLPTATSSLGLFARSRILAIQEGTPGEKVTGAVDWSWGRFGATARVTYYGNATLAATLPVNDYDTGKRAITDLELRYQPKDNPLELAIGANNLFDVYPKPLGLGASTLAGSFGVVTYPYYSPFGFNGRYVYVRAGLHW